MSGLQNRAGIRATGEKFPIDVVFVVDATESMTSLLETVKFKILSLDSDIAERLRKSNRVLESLRVRLIVFRDLYDDSESAFDVTRFFDLPTQQAEFAATVKNIEAFGGGDQPESGLEALFLAMKSGWRNEPQDLKRRHIIMLFTDQDAHELGAKIPVRFAQPPHPRSLSDLKRLWAPHRLQGLMNDRARRMVLFAPDRVESGDGATSTVWAQISQEWENVWISIGEREGLQDVIWDEVVDKLVATI
jgi:hypothetical protein